MDTKRLNSQAEAQFRMMADAVPGLIWTSTKDRLCDFFNLGWLTFTGRNLEQEVGYGWTSGIHPEDLERCLQIYHTGHDLEKEFKIEYRLRRHDGQFRWILDTAVPKYDENGNFTGFIGSCADIDELLESERHQKEFISAEAHQREQQLNEELAAANEEMSASNEELTATIEELQQTKNSLALLNEQLEARIAERIDALASSEHNLRSLVMTAHYPLMILRGEDWIIETANQPLVNLWDKSLDDVIGKPLMEILPEIADQPFPIHLRNVYQTGVGFGEEEQIFHYQSPSGPAVKYVSYYYDPLLDRQGQVSGIIVAADDITEKVRARNLLEKSYQEQQSLNEEFIAINEELADTIEQLSVSNAELANSEERFRNLIRQAPVGICVIRASDLMILELNEGYLELVGRQRAELENHTIWDAVAEAAENYAPIMEEVIATGIAFVAYEHELTLIRNGIDEHVFIDFVYEPIKNTQDQVTAIMVLGIEVTDKVIARRNIEDVEERIRLAVEAAEIGTFEHNYHDNKMVTSERFNAIFGVTETSSRDLLFKMIHPEDRHLSVSAHITARNTGKMFYEARIIHHDGSLHWIRVQANAYFDEHGEPYKLLGTLLDITTFKYLQQQKDDYKHLLLSPGSNHQFSFAPIIAMLTKIDTLPGAERKPSIANRNAY
jgi:PAS domain S-box-containing protein